MKMVTVLSFHVDIDNPKAGVSVVAQDPETLAQTAIHSTDPRRTGSLLMAILSGLMSGGFQSGAHPDHVLPGLGSEAAA